MRCHDIGVASEVSFYSYYVIVCLECAIDYLLSTGTMYSVCLLYMYLRFIISSSKRLPRTTILLLKLPTTLTYESGSRYIILTLCL